MATGGLPASEPPYKRRLNHLTPFYGLAGAHAWTYRAFFR
jgi:hypothetical protein